MVTRCQIPDVYVTCNLEHDSISLSSITPRRERGEPCEYGLKLSVYTKGQWQWPLSDTDTESLLGLECQSNLKLNKVSTLLRPKSSFYTISLCCRVEPLSFRGPVFLQRASQQSEDREENEHSKIQNNPGERLAARQRMLTWQEQELIQDNNTVLSGQTQSDLESSLHATRPNLSSFALTGENMVSSLSTHSKTQTLWLLSKMIYRDLYNLLTTVKKCEGENNLYILRELLWERADQNAKCRLALGWWSRCQPSLKYRQMRTCCNSSATGLWAHCEAGSLIDLWVWFPLETRTYKTEPVLLPSTARWLTLTNHQMRTDREKQGDLMMEQTKSTSAAVENWCRRRNTNVLGCRPRKKRGTKSNCL